MYAIYLLNEIRAPSALTDRTLDTQLLNESKSDSKKNSETIKLQTTTHKKKTTIKNANCERKKEHLQEAHEKKR